MKRFLLSMALLLAFCVPWTQQVRAADTGTVGDGTSTNSFVPFYGYWADTQGAHTQIIYTASDLAGIGLASGKSITQLQFYANSSQSYTALWKVSIGECTETSFSSATFQSTTSMTEVYAGTFAITGGVLTIPFSSDYAYNGGNLIVDIQMTQKGNCPQTAWYGVSSTGASVSFYSSSAGPTALRDWLPKTTFTFEIPATCQVLKTLTATATRTSVTANWTLKNGVENCAGYVVKLSASSDPDDDAISTQNISNPATLSYTFEHLDRETQYYVHARVNCSGDDGESQWTTTTVQTLGLTVCDKTIGTGTTALLGIPTVSGWGNTYSQQIFTAAELTAAGISAGEIKGLTYTWNQASSAVKDFSIYLGPTDKTAFTGTSASDWEDASAFTLNYRDQSMVASAGTVEYHFTTPYVWDGVSNIVVVTMVNQTSSSTGSTGFAALGSSSFSTNVSMYVRQDNSPYTLNPGVAGTLSTSRANISFCQTVEACPAVKNVTISDSTQTTANVSWTAATGDYANDYDLLVSTTPVTEFSTVTPRHTGLTGTTDTLQGLLPYTDYYVYVRVNCNAYEKTDGEAWSEAAYFKTLSNCITPSNLAMELRGKTTGMVTWTGTTQDNNYRYILSTEPVADPDNAPVTADSIAADSVLLTGLTPATHYYFYLSNECGEGDGNSPYMLLEFTTPDACIAPEDIEITDIQKYQMTLTWTASQYNDPTDSYDIYVSTEQVTEYEGLVPTYTGVKGNSKVLDTLQRNTLYYVYIRTNCGSSTTTWEEVYATTADLAPDCNNTQLAATIAEGTTTSYYVPFYGNYGDAYLRSQFVYPASMLGDIAAGTAISGLKFYSDKTSSYTWSKTFEVKIKEVANTTISTFDNSGLQSVYDGTFGVTSDGIFSIDFPSTPYVYQGGNLLIEVTHPQKGTYSSLSWYGVSSTGSSIEGYSYSGISEISPIQMNFLPKMSVYACAEAEACPALENAAIPSDITNTNATLTWNPGKGDWASSYDILLSTTEVTDFTDIEPTVSGITDTTYTFTTLDANTIYYGYVRVNCAMDPYDDGFSGWSPACDFRTELPCLKPTDFSDVGFPTSDKVFLSWIERNQANDWKIFAIAGEDTVTTDVNVSACQTSGDTIRYTLAGLQPSTAYTFNLKTNCGGEYGLSQMAVETPSTTTQSNKTDIDTIKISSAEVVGYVKDADAKTINITLRKGSDRANVAFEIDYSEYAYGMQGDSVPMQSPCDFTSPVSVTVYAQDTNVTATWTITMTEEACATPYDFEVTDIQRRSANLNWHVGDASTDFDFIISDTAVVDFAAWTAPKSIVAENNEGACTYALSGIHRDSTYYAYVRTNCGETFGQWRGGSFTTPGLTVCDSSAIVNDGSATNANVPLYWYALYQSSYQQKSQFIYSSDKLTSLRGKSLNKMTFFTNSDANYGAVTISVKMGITTADNVNSAFESSPAQEVYEGNVVYSGGKWVIDFGTNKFDYPAEGGNILIEMTRSTTGSVYSMASFYGTTGNPAGISRYVSYTSQYALDFLPKVEFGYCVESNACPDIEAIMTSEVTNNGLTVSWTKTAGDYPGTTEIKVSQTQYSDPATEITAADYTTVDTLQEIIDLEPYTRYYIYVRTHCNGEEKEDGWTNWIMTDTITESNCPYPRNVAAVMTGKNTARLSWTNEMGAVFDDENFEYAYSTTEAEPASGTISTTGYGDLTGLANSTTYYCYVRKDCGEGSKSPWIKTSIITVPAMPAVINLTASNISYNAFTATWESNTAEFANETQWEVSVVTTGKTPANWETVNSREYFALGLISETAYDIYVRAKSGSEYSEAEYITVTTTAEPAGCMIVGTGTDGSNCPVSNYDYCYAQLIYPASEVGRAGEIEKILLQRSTYSNVMNNMKVYIGTTSKSSFSSSSDWIPAADLTEVYSGSFATGTEWLELSFNAPYEYDGTSNIVIAISNGHGTWNSIQNFKYTSVSNSLLYRRADGDTTYKYHPGTAGGEIPTYYRTNIEFCFVQSACAKPNHIVVDQITTTTARAHWYPGSTDIAWEYYVSTEELTDAQLTDLMDNGQTVSVYEPVVDLEDLSKDMDYYFYVGIECEVSEELTDTLWTASKSFTTLPTCSAPITAQADNTGDNEITFDATFGQYGTVGTYDFWYWKVGTTDTVKVNGQNSQIVVNNVPGGDYNWQVRANCSGANEGSSRWTAGDTVRVCGAYALPYTQGFEEMPTTYSGPGTIQTICWNDLNAGATLDQYPSYLATTSYHTEGTKSLQFYSSNATDIYVMMPKLANAADYRVAYDWGVENINGSSGNLYVGYMTDITADSTFVKCDSVISTDVPQIKTLYPHTAYLRNVPAGARLAFCYGDAGSSNYYAWLDNIVVDTIPVYNVAYAASPADLGNVAMTYGATDTVSAGRFYEGSKPVLTAVPATGMALTKWTNEDGDSITNVNPWTMTVNADTSIVAHFDTASYNLNVNIAAGTESYGSVSGAGSYKYMREVEFSATPNAHYHLLWNDSSTEMNRTIVMPAKDTTFTAEFIIDQHNVAAAANRADWGTITGTGTFDYGSTVTLVATPSDPHFHFVSWSDGVTDATYVFTLTQDTNLTATFSADQITITAVSNDSTRGVVYGTGVYNYADTAVLHGEAIFPYKLAYWDDDDLSETDTIRVKVLDDRTYTAHFSYNEFKVFGVSNDTTMGTVLGSGSYIYDTIVNLTAVPAAHHHLVSWSNGSSDLVVPVVVRQKTTLTATFGVDSFNINAVANNAAMGQVIGAGIYEYNTPVTLVAKPADHYHFTGWSNGMTNDTITVNATADMTLVANFAIDRVTITANSNDPNLGTVTGGGVYDYGTHVTIATTRAKHVRVAGWWVDGTFMRGGAISKSLVAMTDQDFTAVFVYDNHTVTAVAGEGGTTTGSDTLLHGSVATLTAIPDDHYHFINWTDANNQEVSTLPTISFHVNNDTIVNANFEIDTHNVTLNVSDVTAGSVEGAGTYNYGTPVTIIAVPAAHHVFAGWSNGLTTDTATITLAGDTTVTAIFAVDEHNVTLNVNDPAMGTVTGADTYTHGTIAAIEAIPAAHYHFVGWDNGITSEKANILVDQDSTITATFAIDSHVVTLDINDHAAGSVEGAGTYDYGTQVQIVAVPAAHHVFAGWSNGLTTDTATITLAGDTTITAIFAVDEHNVALNVNDPAMGTVTGAGTYTHGVQAAIEAIPAAHYHFVGWDNGITSEKANILVDQDSTLTATFAIDRHVVTLGMNNIDMGAVSGDGTYDYGTQVTITATPVAHHVFMMWSNGVETPTAVINLVGDTTVTAIFAVDEHNVALNVNDPAMGTVTGAGTYTHGVQAAIEAIPAAHYHFVGWDNGITSEKANILVDQDSTLTATFAIDRHIVTLGRNNIDMGSVTGDGTYDYGTQVTITATPVAHHVFMKWSNGVKTPTAVINLVGDTTVTAIFAVDEHNVTLNVNDPAMGSVTGDGIYTHGTFADIEAIPAAHYHFVDWSNGLTSITEKIYIESDSTITANFEIDEHMLAVMVDDKTHGSVTGTGFYDYGSNITITATPAPHYVFAGWSNGTTTPTTVINLVKDSVITAYFIVDTHRITLNVNNTAFGSVSGAGTYNHGDIASVEATPFAHYHFVDWSNGLTANPANIVVAQDSNLTATFAIDRHDLTIDVDPTMGSVTGAGTYDYGTLVTVVATPAEHSVFSHWSTGATTPTTVINLDQDSTIVAYFDVDNHVVTLNSNNAGMGSTTGAGTYVHGTTATITAIPAAHYHFVAWSNGLTSATAAINVESDTAITAIFAVDEHMVTVATGDAAQGSVTGTGIYAYGSVADITATPAAHHHFVDWSNGVLSDSQSFIVRGDTTFVANFAIDQHSVTVNVNPNEGVVTGAGLYNYGTQVMVTAAPLNDHYTFVGWSNGQTSSILLVDLVKDTTLTAIFTIDSHNVTLNVNNAGMGSVTGAGTYVHGTTATITATANDHYHFVAWSNGLTTATATINVESDTMVTAIFAVNEYTVTVLSNDATKGMVVGGGTYEYGTTANLYAAANDNYHFVNWSNGATAPAYSVVVYGDTTLTANFAADQYAITGVANDANMGSVTGSGMYEYGTYASLTAVPAAHHHFVNWSNGETNATTQVFVTGNISVAANFAVNQYNVTATADDAAAGYIIGAGTYNYGETITLVAVENDHYHFTGWSNGETNASINVTVDGDINLVAYYTADEYEVSLIVTGNGTVTGDGIYHYGDNVTLTATPDPGYRFIGWGDGTTDSVYTFVITSDVTITATFVAVATDVEDVEVLNYVAYTEARNIIVHGAADHRIALYDMSGRLVEMITVASEDQRFEVNAAGVYLIQVDELPATRVVIK